MLLSAILILLFTFTSSLPARPLPYTSVERIRALSLEGWNSAYNLDLKLANALFDQASNVEPLHPRPYLGKAMIVFWRFLLNRRDADKESFLALADRTISAAEKYEETYGDDADVKLCLGTIYGYRSFVYGRTKSYLKGAWDGKKSYDYFYDALKLDPKLYDAYLGLGLFHYFITFIPKPLQWIVSIMGITGDSELGFREIRIASQRGVFAKSEAKYYLAQFLPWQEGEFEASESMLSDLHNQYPENTLLTFTLAVWEMKRADMRAAEEKLSALVHATDEDRVGIRTIAIYKLAECHFRLNDFSRSREEYQRFLASYKDQTYAATANYRIGYCFEISGERDSALVYYRRATRSERRFGDDACNARKADRLLTSTISGPDSILCLAQNAQKSGRYDEALHRYGVLQHSLPGNGDAPAEAVYGLGETMVERKSYAEALPMFREISTMTIEHELWLRPWSHYYTGICLVKSGDIAGARKEFERVLEYDDYDFKSWLEFRSGRELEKLKK